MRSTGARRSRTTRRARPTDSARAASYSGLVLWLAGGSEGWAARESSRREVRERRVSRQTRETTVVSQPPRLAISAESERERRSHASCTASSASLAEPSMR